MNSVLELPFRPNTLGRALKIQMRVWASYFHPSLTGPMRNGYLRS
jgi:hypothetical protein